jgi:predicted DNA-binding transcriptional regulator AlpA
MRKPLRAPAAIEAMRCSRSTFYERIQSGLIPQGTKLDPSGRIVVWWSDELEAIQNAAVEHQAQDGPRRPAAPKQAAEAKRRAAGAGLPLAEAPTA